MVISATHVGGVPMSIPPPEGYKVNFDNPTQRHATITYILCGIGLLLSTLCLLQYLYVKLRLRKKFDAQLVCLAVGWVFSVAVQAVEVFTFATKIIGVHSWEISLNDAQRLRYYVTVTSILVACTSGFCKTSLCLLYCRLSPERWWRWASGGTLILAGGHHAIMLLVVLVGCRPFERNWDLTVSGTCINKPVLYIFTAVLSILSDAVMLILPIPMIVRLQMPLRQKIALVAFFAIGSATVVTAIVRLIVVLSALHSLDLTWTLSSAAVVIIVESNLLVICAALPTLRPFVVDFAPRFIGEKTASTITPAGSGREFQTRSTKTIGGSSTRKKADELGMTITSGETSLDNMKSGGSECQLQAGFTEGESSRHVERVGTGSSSRNSSFENFIAGSWPNRDDIELQRAIVQSDADSINLAH